MKSSDIYIRKATLEDVSGILTLYSQPEMDGKNTISEEQANKLFHKIATYPNYHFYVAEKKEQLIGVFGLLVMDNFGHQGTPSAIVEGVCVSQQYQGKGVGKIMMEAAHNICRSHGCYKMALSSNLRRKDAHQFYEHLGFKQHGISYYIEYE